jgi:hypothetical protein
MIKQSGLPFEIFDYYSSKSKKYISSADCLKHWNATKISDKYKTTIHYFKSIAKKDNPELFFNDVNKIFNDEDCEKINNVEMILNTDKFNKEYNIITINDKQIDIKKNKVLSDCIEKFHKDDKIKFLNIKSSYGTGKSHLLKDLIKIYNYKRILFISYRQTLTSDVVSKFSEYNFVDYRTKQYCSDRLVLQVESLKHLICCGEIIPYDLIILDESESLLNQFSSKTFNSGSRESFEILKALIDCHKTKCISLDGDMSERTYNVLKSINNNMINVVNTFKHEPKTYNFIDNRSKFRNMIYDDIKNKINISVACMSASYIDYLEECIKNDFKDVKICKITGMTSDDIKLDIFDNINEKLKGYNVFLYSPSCEAGCDILLPYKVYGVICNKSCSSRSFRQMLGRIRNPINEKNIFTILNYDFNYSSVENNQFWTFDEVKNNILQFDKECKVIKELVYEEDRIIYKYIVTPYNTTYIYNKVERLNNTSYYFIQNLVNQIKESGNVYTLPITQKLSEEEINDNFKTKAYVNNMIEKYHKEEKLKLKDNVKYIRIKDYQVVNILLNNKDINKDDKKVLYKYLDLNKDVINDKVEKIKQIDINKKISKTSKVLSSDNITKDKYDMLISKQKNNDATENDKLEIIKHAQQKIMIKEDITKDDLINVNYNNIHNYIYLSDITKIKSGTSEIRHEERYKKILMIDNAIKQLGFKNINDTSIIFKKEMEKNFKIENVELIKNWELTTILFRLHKKEKPENFKMFLSLLHTILPNYNIDIKCNNKFDKVEKVVKSSCNIIKLNGIEKIVEKYNLIEQNKEILAEYKEAYENDKLIKHHKDYIEDFEILKNDFSMIIKKDIERDEMGNEDEINYYRNEIKVIDNIIKNHKIIIDRINNFMIIDNNKFKDNLELIKEYKIDDDVINHYLKYY